MQIQHLTARDIRFPTSQGLHGSDAMNPDPDYSAVYVTLETDGDLAGNGIVFTLGRGNDLCKLAVERLEKFIVGRSLESITKNMGEFWREITSDSQLRWLGPEKGTIHMATSAILNAVWDLWAKSVGKPLWKLLADLSPEETVRCIDFRYISDALTPDQALSLLEERREKRAEMESVMRQTGIPAYTTSAGWLGYSDDQIKQLCSDGLKEGWTHFKLKVGADLEQDQHRLDLIRTQIGPDNTLMVDANQVWDVPAAIAYMKELARFEPLWIEEPTNPDDVLGHAAIGREIKPIGIATGEMCHNRVMFKQFFQAGAMDFCQIDSCRLGGVNEVIAVILMAEKFGIPVCPHGGGVGLCEHIQHLALFDAICVSQTRENRITEYVDHLHEHFVDPCVVENGHYQVPTAPGYSIQMHPQSLDEYEFPSGKIWTR